MVRFRAHLIVLAALLLTLGGGIALAQSTDYCEPFDTTNCVVIDEGYQDACCLGDGTQRQVYTCTREIFCCITEYGELETSLGPGFNCYNPGASCQ